MDKNNDQKIGFQRYYSKKLINWLDHMTFPKIFLLWATIILLFGLVYNINANEINYLVHTTTDEPVIELSDCIYFSFITATTTGFGDITPKGSFKLIAIFEVIFGMILLAFVTSRLVSIKQNVILDQIYDVSMSDNINRLRLSLSNFMNTLNEFLIKIQNNSFEEISYKQIQEIEFNFLQYEDMIKKIISLSNSGDMLFKKSLNILDNELLVYNILNSLERISLFFETVRHNKNLSNRFLHSRKILQRTHPKIEKFLDSFQDIEGEIDFENFLGRKDRALKSFKKYISVRKSNIKIKDKSI